MVGLADLWIPILVSGLFVFIASSIIWMALPIHKPDIKFIPNESEFIGSLEPLNLEPGFYMYPNCATSKEMQSDEFKARWKSGPWGTLNVMGSAPNFPMNLLKCFISYTVIAAMCAYLAGLALAPGAEYMEVFRVVGTAGILGFCMGSFAGDFFLGKPTRFIITSFIDGVIFALITAGVFAWLWPDVASVIPAVTP